MERARIGGEKGGGGRRVQIGLDLLELRAAHDAQVLHAVGEAALVELLEEGLVLCAARDHERARQLVAEVVRVRVRVRVRVS